MKKGWLTRIKHSTFEGYNAVGSLSHIHGCDVGRMTYIGNGCSLLYVRIGRFCSIAAHVKIITGRHPARTWVSTHPAFYSADDVCGMTFADQTRFEEKTYVDNAHRFMVEIGNDVWIGSDAMIMDGVTIGDGAIIGAGALVTKNVAPYTIVGGVPAQKIGQRFSDEEIAYLLQHPWWQRDLEWLKQHGYAFSSFSEYKNVME